MKILKNYPLKKISSIKIGGPAKYFIRSRSSSHLISAVDFAKEKKLPWVIIGRASNLIISDKGYRGLVIQNAIDNFKQEKNIITAGAGHSLLGLINKANNLGLQGIEKMAGIPGTVGGAIYGCAGAYGQEIKKVLVSVKVFDGKKIKSFSKKQCKFRYRESVFKKNKKLIILEAVVKLRAGDRAKLKEISRQTIKLREKKYPKKMKSPGSFFKNIKISDIRPKQARDNFVKKIKSDRIMYGKVPAGHLLEQVDALGMREGSIRVAKYHANLIYSKGNGKASDVLKLVKKLKLKVKKKFGINLEEEVQYLGF